MMQMAVFGLTAVCLALLLKEWNPVFSVLFVLLACTMLMLKLAGQLASVLEAVNRIASFAGTEPLYIETIMKAAGIAWLAQFVALVAKDAGQEALAAKIEMAGKLLILALVLPIFTLLIETILAMLPR